MAPSTILSLIACPTPAAVCPRPSTASIAPCIFASSNPNILDISELNCFNVGTKSETAFAILPIANAKSSHPFSPFLKFLIALEMLDVNVFHGERSAKSPFKILSASVTSFMLISPHSMLSMSFSLNPTFFKSSICTLPVPLLSVPDI